MEKDDTIKIEDTIKELTLDTSSIDKDKTYDLSNVSKDAILTVTGSSSYNTIIKGEIKKVILQGTTPRFNLSGLTVTDGITVSQTGSILTVDDNAKLLLTSVKTITINDVELNTADTNLGNITIKDGRFILVGNTNAKKGLTIDSSNSNKIVEVEFTSNIQAALTITANSENSIKLYTNTFAITTLNIKKGKVDITNADFTKITFGDKTSKENDKIILVTNGSAEESVNDTEISNSATEVKGLDITLKTSTADEASYSTLKDSGEITITMKKAGKTVTIEKVEVE